MYKLVEDSPSQALQPLPHSFYWVPVQMYIHIES